MLRTNGHNSSPVGKGVGEVFLENHMVVRGTEGDQSSVGELGDCQRGGHKNTITPKGGIR